MKLKTVQLALAALHGGTFAGIDTLTDVVLKGGKGNPMQGRVKKRNLGSNVMVFSNTNKNSYEAMVKSRLAKEGKPVERFELSPRAWGERVPGTAFVRHTPKGSDKETWYLECIFMEPGLVNYEFNGKLIDPSMITGLPEGRESSGQGGLENQVAIRSIKIDNIIAIRVFGQTFEG